MNFDRLKDSFRRRFHEFSANNQFSDHDSLNRQLVFIGSLETTEQIVSECVKFFPELDPYYLADHIYDDALSFFCNLPAATRNSVMANIKINSKYLKLFGNGDFETEQDPIDFSRERVHSMQQPYPYRNKIFSENTSCQSFSIDEYDLTSTNGEFPSYPLYCLNNADILELVNRRRNNTVSLTSVDDKGSVDYRNCVMHTKTDDQNKNLQQMQNLNVIFNQKDYSNMQQLEQLQNQGIKYDEQKMAEEFLINHQIRTKHQSISDLPHANVNHNNTSTTYQYSNSDKIQHLDENAQLNFYTTQLHDNPTSLVNFNKLISSQMETVTETLKKFDTTEKMLELIADPANDFLETYRKDEITNKISNIHDLACKQTDQQNLKYSENQQMFYNNYGYYPEK